MPEPETTPPAAGEICGCCTFGNHTEPCTCDGSNCCHPEKHRPAVPVPGLRDQIAGAVQPLLMDNLPKPIAAVRAEEIADVVLFVLQQNRAELASLAVNAMNALIDEQRHYKIACDEIARLKADQERYENDVVGRFNQQATWLARRAGEAEAALDKVRGIDPDKLDLLADWFDTDDARKGPGRDFAVQADLRQWARTLRALTPPVPADQPEGGVG